MDIHGETSFEDLSFQHPFSLRKLFGGRGYGFAWDKMIICPILINTYAKASPQWCPSYSHGLLPLPKDHKNKKAFEG